MRFREVIQGLEKEFPKRVSREFFRVNREAKRSFQGLSLGEWGNSVRQTEQAVLLIPVKGNGAAHQRFEGDLDGLGPIKDRVLHLG